MKLPFNFTTNNVKGLGTKQKRLEMCRRLKDLVKYNGIIFMQESHSCKINEQIWKKYFGEEN